MVLILDLRSMVSIIAGFQSTGCTVVMMTSKVMGKPQLYVDLKPQKFHYRNWIYHIYSRISRPLKIESIYGPKSLTRV